LKKQIRALIEIGAIYLAFSIVLDFLLGGYPVLSWSALGIAFIIFAILILDVLLELTPRSASDRPPAAIEQEDELMRLEYLSAKAIDDGDPDAGLLLSNRLRSIGFAIAAYRFNTSEAALRAMVEQDSNSFRDKLGDQAMAEILTTNLATNLVTRRDTDSLEYCLAKIEDWSK
jgi:hypothetical protein